MLMEAVKHGPQCYCIVCDSSPGFYNFLKIILYFLVHKKMFLYPDGTTLGGPFLHEPWLSKAQALQAQPSITEEEYVASFVHFLAAISGCCTPIYLVSIDVFDPFVP